MSLKRQFSNMTRGQNFIGQQKDSIWKNRILPRPESSIVTEKPLPSEEEELYENGIPRWLRCGGKKNVEIAETKNMWYTGK